MKRAFTLIEILVVVGLVAVVAALGLVAMTVLQKSSRNNERKTTLATLAVKIEDLRKINRSYPVTTSVVFSELQVTINTQKVLDLKGVNRSGIDTTGSYTKYYYERTTAGFILCAKLEGGSIHSAGTVKDGCVGKLWV